MNKLVKETLEFIEKFNSLEADSPHRSTYRNVLEVLLEGLMGTELPADKGPWLVSVTETSVRLESEDFKHDANLIVTGDFLGIEEKDAYARRLANQLNSLAINSATTQLKLKKVPMGEFFYTQTGEQIQLTAAETKALRNCGPLGDLLLKASYSSGIGRTLHVKNNLTLKEQDITDYSSW